MANLQSYINKLSETKLKKLINLALLAFIFISFWVWCYSYLFNSDYFLLPKGNKYPIFIESIINLILFSINFYFIIGFSLALFDKILFKIIIFFALTSAIIDFIFNSNAFIVSLIYPFIFCIGCQLFQKRIIDKSFIFLSLRYFIISFIGSKYNEVFAPIKTNKLAYIDVLNLTIKEKIFYQIDFTVVLIFLFYVLGVYFYGQLECFRFQQNRFSKTSNDNAFQKQIAKLKRWQQLVMRGIWYLAQVFQVALMIVISKYVTNTFIELAVIYLLFLFTRRILEFCWHSENYWICTALTVSTFVIASNTVNSIIPIKYAISPTILLGMGIAFVTYKIYFYTFDHLEMIKNIRYKSLYIANLKNHNRHLMNLLKPQDPKKMTLEELTLLCSRKQLSTENADFAIKAFYYKLPEKELAYDLKIGLDSIKKKKSRLLAKLKSPF